MPWSLQTRSWARILGIECGAWRAWTRLRSSRLLRGLASWVGCNGDFDWIPASGAAHSAMWVSDGSRSSAQPTWPPSLWRDRPVTKEIPLRCSGRWLNQFSSTSTCSLDSKRLDLRASLVEERVWGGRMERPAHLHPPHTSPCSLALCSSLPWEFQGGIVDGLIADPGIRGLTSIVIDSITVVTLGHSTLWG